LLDAAEEAAAAGEGRAPPNDSLNLKELPGALMSTALELPLLLGLLVEEGAAVGAAVAAAIGTGDAAGAGVAREGLLCSASESESVDDSEKRALMARVASWKGRAVQNTQKKKHMNEQWLPG
jgi:hypothetical protein